MALDEARGGGLVPGAGKLRGGGRPEPVTKAGSGLDDYFVGEFARFRCGGRFSVFVLLDVFGFLTSFFCFFSPMFSTP